MMSDKVRINMCQECNQPFPALYDLDNQCGDCRQNFLARSFYQEGKPNLAAMFTAQPETNDPNVSDDWRKTIKRGNPMEMSWRILKMTPEEMEAAGFHEAAAQMRQMQAEENRLKQQTQATAPRMTPQIQVNYQDQIDLRRQKELDAQQIRRVTRGGRINSREAKELVQAYKTKYGEHPTRVPKTLGRRS